MDDKLTPEQQDFELKVIALKACINSKNITQDAKEIYEWLKESTKDKQNG